MVSEPHAFSNTHISKHPSSAGGERREPHPFSNAHVPTTLCTQAAEQSEPQALPSAHIPVTFVVSICFYSYAVAEYLLETPLGLYNRIGYPFELNGDDSMT